MAAMIHKQLTWHNGAPFSEMFGDIYYNPDNGLSETEHVFIHGNRLTERFVIAQHFTIAELGFGTGLNLLATWQRFLEIAPPAATLHYISFERYPLSPAQMQDACAHWPALGTLAKRLIAQLHLWGEGIYRIHNERLVLTLVIGDAADTLPQMDFTADAWFLDGFAPAKNPQMWSEALLLEVARHTRHGGTAATFTSAGTVRRSLAAGGFEVCKVPGFGKKREMTVATMTANTQRLCPAPPTQVRIAGGGIAGCAAAYSLARRGMAVALYEPTALGSGASGNEAGALYPPLHKQMSAAMHGYWDALRYVPHLLERLEIEPLSRGMIKLPATPQQAQLWPHLPEMLDLPPEALHWLAQDEASAKAGTALVSGGVYLPQSLAVDVATLCRKLTDHPRITVYSQALAPDDEATPTLIACGMHARAWHSALPLHANRGQVSIIAADHVYTMPSCIVSHRGYAIALKNGEVLVGATYDRGNESCTHTPADNEENLATARAFTPQLLAGDAQVLRARASVRTVTPDRMPLIGQLPGSNRYISCGHGSRGLLSAPMAAEWLADMLCDTPPALRRDSAALWDVARYLAPAAM